MTVMLPARPARPFSAPRRWWGAAAVLCALLSPTPLAAQVEGGGDDPYWTDQLRAAERSALRGRLGEAVAGFEAIVYPDEEDAEEPAPQAVLWRAQLGLLDLQRIRGEYEAVLEGLAEMPAEAQALRGWRLLRGRVLHTVGRYDEAAAEWGALLEQRGEDVEVRHWLARTLEQSGDRAGAAEQWQRVVDDARRSDDAVVLTCAGRALMRRPDAESLVAASRLFVRAIEADPDRPDARIAFGWAHFLAYGEAAGLPSGEKALTTVLREHGEVEEALVALYRLRRANFQLDPAKTEDYLSRALSLNPKSVPALMERGILALRDRNFTLAAEIFDAALAVNPNHREVLSHRAATAHLLNEPGDEAALRERLLAIDAGYADTYRHLGDHLVALYRFEDAVPYYERALSEEPESVSALHGLAKALVYCARGDEALTHLRRAAQLQKGFVDPWRDNAIAVQELLQEQYRTVEADGLRLVLHYDDVEVLERYLVPVLAEARRELGAKYGHVEDQVVTAEVYHTWNDFSVRTIGFRGFHALGACFGRFMTLVSPVDDQLRRQDFMWTATAWHEYAHVLTLALSKHRVPRWLTEGCSVYEERQKDPSWERGMTRELFDAFHNNEIAPLRHLNRLFRGPRILFGYYQGGLIVEYLAEHHGFDAVLEMLRGYGEDRSTEELFDGIFGLQPEEFDRAFRAWVETTQLRGLDLVPRYSAASMDHLRERALRAPDDVAVQVALGHGYLQRGQLIDAAAALREALRADPEDGDALLLHAALLERRRAFDEAAARYVAGFAQGADDFDARVGYGRLLERSGDLEGALDQYQRAKACWPRCTDQQVAPNLLLARVLRALDRDEEAMMELKSFVRRTGRAFAPRLELAAMERKNGNRQEEIRLLREAVAIDPFMRELHVLLGEALLAAEQPREALGEFEMALAVRPHLDRAHVGKPPAEVPDPAAAVEREARARICVSAARAAHRIGEVDAALAWLQRALGESADGEAADSAARLLRSWNR